jgi:hypothetical protein
VDSSSGYRYYGADQIATAQTIRRLRELEMPVEQVKGVLQAAGAFDFFSIRGAHTLADLRGPDQVALARDLYAYAHLPMIVGIVLFAFAIAGDLDEQPAGGKV